MQKRHKGPEDRFEVFKYPRAWEEEYRKTRIVKEWWRSFPDQFDEHYQGKRDPRTLLYLAQYALMYLLRRDHGIQSMTWLHLAAVDRATRTRLATGKSWKRPSPNPGAEAARTQRHWDVMRTQMGPTKFDALQEAIVRAGFYGHKGEPDLFCYDDRGTWFFAEAKAADNLHASQRQWFGIAESLPGMARRIHLYRLVPS